MENRIHETAIIGPGVALGSNNTIGPYCVIIGPCEIGDSNWIGPHVAIGTPGEYQGLSHPVAWESGNGGLVKIGSNNTFREFSTIQVSPNTVTRIGDGCYVMTKSHIPHDSVIEDAVKLGCSVIVGGYGHIGKSAYLGLGSIIHQRLYVGPGAMVGMGAIVTKNVPPLAKTYGNPARLMGFNKVKAMEFSLTELDSDLISEAYSEAKLPDVSNLSQTTQELFLPYLEKI
jgi:UDP-N-acetylglucosamine acyltransferase